MRILSCIMLSGSLILQNNISAQEHKHSPVKKYFAEQILPIMAHTGSIVSGLYTLMVFSKSQVFSPAARLLLTPIGASAVFGAMAGPYVVSGAIHNYLSEEPSGENNYVHTLSSTSQSMLRFGKKLLVGSGIALAGVCIAALCGNQHALDILKWAESVHIDISIKNS